MRVIIAEFMDEAAVGSLRRRFTTTYDAGLADRRAALLGAVRAADALIVRNRIRVDAELLAAGAGLRAGAYDELADATAAALVYAEARGLAQRGIDRLAQGIEDAG